MKKLFWTLVIACSAAGCSTSPVRYFPAFSSSAVAARSSILLADVFVVDDCLGDTNRVQLPWNRELGDSMLQFFTDRAGLKGYLPGKSLLTSVGLTVPKRKLFRSAAALQDQSAPDDSLPVLSPPLYLHAGLESDSAYRASLETAYRALLQSAPDAGAQHTMIQGGTDLAGHTGAELVYVIFLGGFNIPLTERLRDDQMSTEQTVGSIGVRPASQTAVTLYVFETTGGELLWADRAESKGGTVNLAKAQQLLEQLIDRLP